MEKHIVDAVKLMNELATDLHHAVHVPGCRCALGVRKLDRAIHYLANPDRYQRPKRGPSNVKGGKRRANLTYGKFGVPGENVK